MRARISCTPNARVGLPDPDTRNSDRWDHSLTHMSIKLSRQSYVAQLPHIRGYLFCATRVKTGGKSLRISRMVFTSDGVWIHDSFCVTSTLEAYLRQKKGEAKITSPITTKLWLVVVGWISPRPRQELRSNELLSKVVTTSTYEEWKWLRNGSWKPLSPPLQDISSRVTEVEGHVLNLKVLGIELVNYVYRTCTLAAPTSTHM